ncbi:MAG: HAMP domain-containing histidine kinase, partial [Clostridiales bacterium]|nr:HAMP domain-containing histidine kinase [Clostridiales bacterium]
RVVQDDFSHILPEDDDGDFAILSHNFNQMANRIKLSLKALQDDKLFLKDTISDISHQLKTPLSSLMVFNELMLKDEDMDPASKTTFLERSNSQLERMEWLIVNLLKMARLESGSIDFKDDYIPLIHPINIALDTLSSKVSDKKIDIDVMGDLKNTFIYGDSDWLGEAFINIIKNSIEHTPSNGKIYICLSHTPIFSQVEIKDTGEGISEEDLPHIFKRFYRSSSSVKVESVGIGLSLSKIIIEGHDGNIWVKSEKGAGTKFIITFLMNTV